MTNLHRLNTKIMKYLAYSVIVLVAINLALLFIPYIEVYQPSQSITKLDKTEYIGWYKSTSSPAGFVIPLFMPGIPLLLTFLSYVKSSRSKKGKNQLVQLINNSLEKPIRNDFLKLGCLVNLGFIFITNAFLKNDVANLQIPDAYCRLTSIGILNIVCTALLFVLLIILTVLTKHYCALADAQKAEALEAFRNNGYDIEKPDDYIIDTEDDVYESEGKE